MEKRVKAYYLIAVYVVSLLIMTMYETSKHLLLGDMSLFTSHAITVLFTSAMAVCIGNYLINFVQKYMDRIYELSVYNENLKTDLIKKELGYARELQASMIPSNFPLFPDRGDFECYGCYIAAGYVGGDFYDIFFIDNTRICFIVGDVCGKGIPAALLMTKCMNMMHYEAQHHATPKQILFNVNNQLSKNNTQLMFVTAFCGVLDLESGELVYANAGHNPPVISHDGNSFEFIEISDSLVLGIKQSFLYKEKTIIMKPGAAIVLYTDGVTEATDNSYQLFGNERLLNCLNALECAHPKLVVDFISSTVKSFIKNMPPSDDMAIFAIHYKGEVEAPGVFCNNQFCEICLEQRQS